MMQHEHSVRVYYEDTDAGGVMYHATYLRFAERARTEALRDAGLPHADMLAQHGVMFMVRRLDLETIRTHSLAASGATVTLRQEFLIAEEPIAVARVMLACVKAATGSAARIPLAWRTALAA